MKFKSYVATATLMFCGTMLFAQQAENPNPYATLGHTPYVIGDERKITPENAIFVIENTDNGTKLTHNTMTGVIKTFAGDGSMINEKKLKENERAWYVPDPRAEKYYNISPYAYANNNPVRYVDPTGMIWADPQEAARLVQNIDTKITSLNDAIKNDRTMLEKGGLNESQIANTNERISEAQNRISNLDKSKTDIAMLGADQKNTYTFSPTGDGKFGVRMGDDGKIHIKTESDAFSIHEISHIRQSLNAGGLKFSPFGDLLNAGKTPRGIALMEVEAYQMQYSFDKSFPGNLKGKGYNGIDIHSIGAIRNNGMSAYPEINKYSRDLIKFQKEQRKLYGIP